MDEAQLVQNNDGTVIANMRWKDSPTKGRGIALSTDGGTSFSNVSVDPMLKTAVCQASVFRSPQNGLISSTTGRVGGAIRRSATGLPSSWQSNVLEITNATTAFGFSALCDHPNKGKGGMLYETVLCPQGKSRDNCTCPGPPRSISCVQKPRCAGCTGVIVFSVFPLVF